MNYNMYKIIFHFNSGDSFMCNLDENKMNLLMARACLSIKKGSFLKLFTSEGEMIINSSSIAYIRIEKKNEP